MFVGTRRIAILVGCRHTYNIKHSELLNRDFGIQCMVPEQFYLKIGGYWKLQIMNDEAIFVYTFGSALSTVHTHLVLNTDKHHPL